MDSHDRGAARANPRASRSHTSWSRTKISRRPGPKRLSRGRPRARPGSTGASSTPRRSGSIPIDGGRDWPLRGTVLANAAKPDREASPSRHRPRYSRRGRGRRPSRLLGRGTFGAKRPHLSRGSAEKFASGADVRRPSGREEAEGRGSLTCAPTSTPRSRTSRRTGRSGRCEKNALHPNLHHPTERNRLPPSCSPCSRLAPSPPATA